MIALDSSTHRYYTGERPVISVTQALHLAGEIDDKWYTGSAAERGSRVHRATQYLDERWGTRRQREELAREAVLPEEWGYVASWQDACRAMRLRVELIEHRVYNARHDYAGTIDRTATVPLDGDRESVIVDLKTGPRQAWHALQLAAYAMTLEKPQIYRRLAVYLGVDRFSVHEFPRDELSLDFRRFLTALTKGRKLWSTCNRTAEARASADS